MLNRAVLRPLYLSIVSCLLCISHPAMANTSATQDNIAAPQSVSQATPSQDISTPAEQKISDADSAYQLLRESEDAVHNLSYEISYFFLLSQSIEPLRFRHTKVDDKTYAHLTHLSGTSREAIQRGDVVSYFEPNLAPFSISNTELQGVLPALYATDVDELKAFYDFIPMGKGREAGVDCQVVRLVSKDGNRYSYVLWIDKKSKLIARADVLDHTGDVVEQYRALTLVVSAKVNKLLLGLDSVKLPPVISPKLNSINSFSWTIGWLPNGFKLINNTRHRLMNSEQYVESQLYSDGLFNFSVYLSEVQGVNLNKHVVRQGKRTLYSENVGKYEVSVIGDIPPETARNIARSIQEVAQDEKSQEKVQ